MCVSGSAVVLKHDQYDASITAAADEVSEASMGLALPGFAKGEAFGQMYAPGPMDYPLRISGVDIFVGAPLLAAEPSGVQVDIEIYSGEATGPAPPASAKKFSISKSLKGGSAIQVAFDASDPDGAPDLVYSGKVWLMIRFTDTGTADDADWGPGSCSVLPCGCQAVSPIHDDLYTPQANVMHFFDPSAGGCDQPPTTWTWLETIVPGAGDFVMRLRADTKSCE